MVIQQLPVVLSEPALLDLQRIGSRIFETSGSENIALSFIDRIKARCQRIGDAPRGGRARDDLLPGLRTVPFEHSAVIAYIVLGELVMITNVFYGGHDFEALLGGGKLGNDL